MLIGYARVFTDGQNLGLQPGAVRLAGCGRVCEDRISGAKAARRGGVFTVRHGYVLKALRELLGCTLAEVPAPVGQALEPGFAREQRRAAGLPP